MDTSPASAVIAECCEDTAGNSYCKGEMTNGLQNAHRPAPLGDPASAFQLFVWTAQEVTVNPASVVVEHKSSTDCTHQHRVYRGDHNQQMIAWPQQQETR